MNIKSIGPGTVSLVTTLLIQAAGVIYFISALASTVSFHEDRLTKTEQTIEQLSDKIAVLSEDLKLLRDQQKNINAEHKMLFEKTNLYDGVYAPAESRKY